jgi:hypothetical protein
MVGKQKGAGGRGAERAVGERSAAAAGCAEGVAVGRRRVVAATARRSFSSGGANATFSAGLGAVWLIRPCVARRRVYWGRGRLQSRAGSCVSSAVRDRGGTLEQSGDASGVQAGVGADSGAERERRGPGMEVAACARRYAGVVALRVFALALISLDSCMR